jgi:hypothetical protein
MLLADYQQTGHEGEVIRYVRAARAEKTYSGKNVSSTSPLPFAAPFSISI